MKLFIIKLLHTVIWAFMAACVIYVLAAGILGFLNGYVYFAIAAVLGEAAVLVAFKWRCPLTIIAEKYAGNREPNFDIFLPKFIAEHNKTIFTALFVIGLILIGLRIIY